MNILSLFDGISCAQLALQRAKIKYNNYYSSEINKNAIKITQKNFPNTIQLGNIKNINIDFDVDLLFGGSPCRNLSKTATNGGSLNWVNFEAGLVGDSALFFEFVKILNSVKPKYFIFENVEMKKEYEDIISKELGVKPIKLCSSDFSPQNRKRLYWTNIEITKPTIKNTQLISDVIEKNVHEKFYYKHEIEMLDTEKMYGYIKFPFKAHDIARRVYKINQKSPTITSCRGGNLQKKIFDGKGVRKLTPVEYERLQTLPDDYTKGISDSERYNCIGDAWTVDVITYLLQNI